MLHFRPDDEESFWERDLSTGERNGFFRTGDLGCIDEGLILHFKGRLKELIKVNTK